MKVSRLAFELSLQLKNLENKKILVAFSGGLDSCVLLQLLLELKDRLAFELAVAHIHHGESAGSERQKIYRDEALAFSKKRAELLGCRFFFKKADASKFKTKGLTQNHMSEAALRKVRRELLEKIRVENGFDLIAFAHHAQDLFETRLIRLVRGTGLKGLESMSLLSQNKLRPVLKHWPEEILEYAEKNKIEYLKDPSNLDTHYLRNWVRHKWLKDLEVKRPGSIQAFARSLELLCETSQSSSQENEVLQANRAIIDREKFRLLSVKAQAQLIANYLANFAGKTSGKLEQKNYSSNMVREICKRLDTPRKQLMFVVAGLEWTADAKQIQARELI